MREMIDWNRFSTEALSNDLAIAKLAVQPESLAVYSSRADTEEIARSFVDAKRAALPQIEEVLRSRGVDPDTIPAFEW